MAVAFTVAFSGAMPFLLALVPAFVLSAVACLVLLRLVCGGGGGGKGPVQGVSFQAPDAVHTPVGEPAPGTSLPKQPAAKTPAAEAPEKQAPATKTKAKKPAAKKKAAKAKADDLTQIKGLGPRFQKTLNAGGILSFAQLARLDEAALDKLDADRPGLKARALKEDWAGQAKTYDKDGAGE
ncbi:hypothetical protein [Pseudooceanicola sp. HF7]|uniref:hypothetical protein n=1 Tax=Pseudooceanicola sp. HF7 TaxID=2721560 RepID=UPI00142FEF1A|nr:hypothetical protein [Pseudooceanicola sp. HF7]NIZ09202.1 hypothetical protein [Pseudooceanicola sp. HF7]